MGSTTCTVSERRRAAWRMRLRSASRTAAACAAVGVTTLYGPEFLRARHIKFAAFSYLTAVTIISDATAGEALRGCWHALCATAQVVPLAVLWRWLLGPAAQMPPLAAGAVVAAAAFAVALPERTHLTAKKIAFGQIVLVSCAAVLGDGSTGGYMHPVYLGASTALGAVAALFALLLPYPSRASSKVQELCRLYAENASQRMNLYLRALTATDKLTKIELISQSKPLSETGSKLFQSIKISEDGLWWERPWRKPTKLGERLQNMELEMRGIEYSLISSATATPFQGAEQQQISEFTQAISTRIEERIEQLRCYSPFNSKVETELVPNSSSLPDPKLPSPNHGWLSFHLSCIHMFLNEAACCNAEPPTKTETGFKRCIPSHERLMFATKCSLSLSLAVLLGLLFDKENGCWAGLTIAISFVEGRQAIFTVANSRLQGTALGSVYGVICCFLFHYEVLRLLALVPWIIVTTSLRHSRMFGQTGGVSAAIGALVILGRKNYGVPTEFAIARLTEVFIGITAFIVVDLFLQPTTAATLARNHAYLTASALQDCVKGTRMQKNQTSDEFLDMKEREKHLNQLVSQLKGLVADAETEPSFWFLPFRASCYKKLVRTFTNAVDMLCFITHNLELLSKLAETESGSKFQEQINNEVQLFEETLSSAYTHLEQGIVTKPEAVLEDMEAGKLCSREKPGVPLTEHTEASLAREDEGEDDKNQREMVIRYLNATRFCISSLMKEMEDITFCLRDIGSLVD
ncbi:uncharacterized protein LOC125216685 [Salvia hispanica]|uniref:uncharacterized protein LOC125216685 n=1 Tax=Salvia hispanica TaxID=49212 RepID=UPI002009C0BE|nr:uncharacterized protein LOC125216685 [Salvia hispanica]